MSEELASMSIDEFLASARAGLTRVNPAEMRDLVKQGALLVDIRPLELRQRDGDLEGAIVIGMNVLEWRLAPTSESRIVDVDPERKVIVVCDQGYSSSLAASRMQALGLRGATDLIGGFQALVEEGLV